MVVPLMAPTRSSSPARSASGCFTPRRPADGRDRVTADRTLCGAQAYNLIPRHSHRHAPPHRAAPAAGPRRSPASARRHAAPPPLRRRADTVRWKNGRAYEGAIAERTPQGVRVQLAFGHIVIPADQVIAIEQAPSALATYLERKAALDARAG